MADTYKHYVCDGNTSDFSIPFDYIHRSYVKVKVNNEPYTNFIFLAGDRIQLDYKPPNGTIVTVYRDTPKEKRFVKFTDGAILDDDDLNLDGDQVFFILQEYLDQLSGTLKLDDDQKYNALNHIIKNLGIPKADHDAANKLYVDNKLAEDISTVEQYKNQAQEAALEAQGYANQAQESAESIVESANTATTKAAEALNSANTAGIKANEASQSAANALISEANALQSANTAIAKADEASNSASQASISEVNAHNSEVNAAISEAHAAASANAAAISETNAGVSASNAAESATQAETSAQNAQTYAASVNPSEICHIIGSGLPNETYTKTESDSIFAAIEHEHPPVDTARIGDIKFIPHTNIPEGWLECNGAAISRTEFSELFEVIGTTFGEGDGETTFNLPDLRGEFIRGWDHGKGTDPDRQLGSWQADAFQGHWHNTNTSNSGGANPDNFYLSSTSITSYEGTKLAKTPTSDGVNGTPRTANETRPRNIAFMFIIKAKHIAGSDPAVEGSNADTLDGLHASAFALATGSNSQQFSVAAATSNDHAVNLGQFESSKFDNGYQKLPSGMILQWGKTPIGSGLAVVDVIFPVVFLQKAIIALAINQSSAYTAGVSITSTSGMLIYNTSSYANAGTVHWFAIGY